MGVPSNRSRLPASEVTCLAVGYRSEGAARRRIARLGVRLVTVIDPHARGPTIGDVCAVSVVARTVAHAEILATTIFVTGLHAAIPLLNDGAAGFGRLRRWPELHTAPTDPS